MGIDADCEELLLRSGAPCGGAARRFMRQTLARIKIFAPPFSQNFTGAARAQLRSAAWPVELDVRAPQLRLVQ
jgi:hypothetical protein